MIRKILISILLIFSILQIKANEPIRYGAIGGLNINTVTSDGTKNSVGFHVGGKVELPIKEHFYLEGSLLLSMKGYKSDAFIHEEGNKSIKITQENYYLNIPIHFGYKYSVSNNCSLFISGGGDLGLGLFGKLKNEISSKTTSSDLYKDGRGDKRFDCGLGVKIGTELINKIQLSASYDWGLININKNYNDCKNRNLMVSCAYMF